jgi:hypothetical protein
MRFADETALLRTLFGDDFYHRLSIVTCHSSLVVNRRVPATDR